MAERDQVPTQRFILTCVGLLGFDQTCIVLGDYLPSLDPRVDKSSYDRKGLSDSRNTLEAQIAKYSRQHGRLNGPHSQRGM